MFRRWVVVLGLAAVGFILPAPLRAAGEFTTTFDTTYIVNAAGLTSVSLHITLTNNLAATFAEEYTLTFGSTRLKNLTAQTAKGQAIPTDLKTTGNQLVVNLKFPSPVVGKGQVQDFFVKYDDPDSAQKIGTVLEIMVPKLESASQANSYRVTIMVPVEFGQPAIISPGTYHQTTDPVYTKLEFSGDVLKSTGITAIFGDRQIYAVDLTYHLHNPTVTPLETQIALPPDTPYQKMYYTLIEPPPRAIHTDPDGNWIADYTLEPKSRLTVTVAGQAIAYIRPTVAVPQPTDRLKDYLVEQKYWPVNDPEIQKLAQTYNTPQAIYNYLVSTFKYDYARIDNRSTARLGANKALASPQSSLCLEFTDAFITLARAAGIPARLLTGYAYTENAQIRPLSLVQDVLHAWPEYYNFQTRAWQPVDPTWGVTTGGLDYFNSFDFNHLVFAIQGTYSDHPFPAGYYKVGQEETKDVDITLDNAIPDNTLVLQSALTTPRLTAVYLGSSATLTVTNRSPYALHRLPLQLSGHNLEVVQPPGNLDLELLPYQSTTVPVQFSTPALNLPAQLTVTAHDYHQTFTISRLPLGTVKTVGFVAAAVTVGCLAATGTLVTRRLLVSRRRSQNSVYRQGQKTPHSPA